MKGTIYFAQMVTGPIKIGFTANLDQRIANLGYGVPGGLKLLVSIPGTPATESWLHQKFNANRISGEWFAASDRLLAFVDTLIAEGNLALPEALRGDEISAPVKLPQDDEIKERCIFYLRRLAEPIRAGDSVRKQIVRVGQRTGLPKGRIRTLWYGNARTISATEFLIIREHFDISVAATDADFHRETIDHLGHALRRMGAKLSEKEG